MNSFADLDKVFAEHRDNAEFKCGEGCFCWKVQELLEKRDEVSGVRKYHLAEINRSHPKILATSNDVEIDGAAETFYQKWHQDLYVIEVDPTGEIEIRPI